MEMEIEGLVTKIQRLEKELAVKELENKQLKEKLKPYIELEDIAIENLKENTALNMHILKRFSKLHL